MLKPLVRVVWFSRSSLSSNRQHLKLCRSSWLQIQRSRIRFTPLLAFLRSSWSITGGPLSHVRITEELFEWKSTDSGSRKPRLTAVGIRCSDYATSSIPQKLVLTSLICGGRSVGIVGSSLLSIATAIRYCFARLDVRGIKQFSRNRFSGDILAMYKILRIVSSNRVVM
jgi:hypothetical protein